MALGLGLPTWILDVIACPADCQGRLAIQAGGRPGREGLLDGTVRCTRCGAPYPVLGGVVVVVPSPAAWVGSYRDPIVAALAEHGLAHPAALDIIDTFASAAPFAEPMRFGDDWVPGEGPDAPEIQGPPGGTPGAFAFRRFLTGAMSAGPNEVLLQLIGSRPTGTVIELGCGAGVLTPLLRAQAARLVVCDLSLRAVLRALTGAFAGGEAPIAAAVLDASALPARSNAARLVVAANVVDLLDHPYHFAAGVARALPKGGRLALSTPDPGLGDDDPDVLTELLEDAGFVIRDAVDGVPWVRAHSTRRYEVYFTRVLVAARS